ncbi:MAG: radical SAM protein [Candidatus Omnitrophica bacterium]|nr:radical SAM protein [Candidatus Omnitrophota bacterium]
MTKIAFINPSPNLKSLYGRLSKEASRLPPLGLLYLASTMKSAGYEARIIDAPAQNLSNKEAVSTALEWGARYIGVTATTDIIFAAGEIADLIKARTKDTLVIIGGAHVTAVPEDTLNKFRSFDFGIVGEGEKTLKEVVDALESGLNVYEVKGIAYRKDNKVKITGPRDFVEDLDSLGYPSWQLLPEIPKFYKPTLLNYKRLPAVSLVTSRGCPGKCAFCDTRVFGSRYRMHSADYVLETVRYLKDNFGIKEICFYDDVFTIFKKRLTQICKGFQDSVKGIHWSCQARVNAVDYEMMKMMKKSGCWKISFGIESGADSVLKLMDKRATAEQAKKAIRLAKRAGLEVEGYFILGFFGENSDTIKATNKFIMNSDLDIALLSYFLPLPGSPAYPNANKYGEFNEDWENMNAFDSENLQFIPHGMSNKELVKAQKEIYRNFYFRPKTFAKYAFKMIKDPVCAVKFLKAFSSFITFVSKES